jgi:CheY-like chemotaxis protein
VQRIVARILEKHEYRVLKAADADEALATLAAEGAELILTDLVMPKISGVELASRPGRSGQGSRRGSLPVIPRRDPGSRCGARVGFHPNRRPQG